MAGATPSTDRTLSDELGLSLADKCGSGGAAPCDESAHSIPVCGTCGEPSPNGHVCGWCVSAGIDEAVERVTTVADGATFMCVYGFDCNRPDQIRADLRAILAYREEALAETGCRDRADLIDMALVGKSLMEAIHQLVTSPGQFRGWAPADDPAEIVSDMANALDDAEALASQQAETIGKLVQYVASSASNGCATARALLRALQSKEQADG